MGEELELRSGSHSPNSPERAPAPTLLSWPTHPLPVSQIAQIEASAHICPCLPSLQASLLWSPLSLAFPLPPVSQTRLHPSVLISPLGWVVSMCPWTPASGPLPRLCASPARPRPRPFLHPPGSDPGSPALEWIAFVCPMLRGALQKHL